MGVLTTALFSHEIHEAAERGDLETVKALLSEDPSLLHDNSGAEGRYPLHCAIRGNRGDVARFCIEQGADVNAKDIHGASLLNYASYWGLIDIVNLLIEEGALVKKDATPRGVTPLHWAAAQGHSEIVKILIQKGVDVNANQFRGRTPLHMAVRSGHTDTARMLIQKGAALNVQDDRGGATPLHLAAGSGNVKAVELLLSENADVNLRMHDGRSAFRLAVESGDIDAVTLLLSQVDDVSEKDLHYGMTPLHRASIDGYKDVTECLLERGVDVNARDDAGRTPLYYAGKYGHCGIADLLKVNGGTTGEPEENCGYASLLRDDLSSGEVIIWYLGHSGWALKTQSKLLVFDYYEYGRIPDEPVLANGRIHPPEIQGLDVTVFASHAHEDHFDDIILTWESHLDRIQYVFGWRAFEDGSYVLMDGEREIRTVDGIEIVRIASELENESAFLVKVDGVTIYHGGDYYFREKDSGNIASLAEKYGVIDLAFIESGFRHICNSTIEKLRPRVMFPMHARNNESIYKQYAEKAAQEFPNTTFVCAENRGDRFHYRNGEVD